MCSILETYSFWDYPDIRIGNLPTTHKSEKFRPFTKCNVKYKRTDALSL